MSFASNKRRPAGRRSGDTIPNSKESKREKGSSLNSDSLAPKPLASSLYVPVSQAHCPHKRSISVTSFLPPPALELFGAIATELKPLAGTDD